jgi:hypothetical protein
MFVGCGCPRALGHRAFARTNCLRARGGRSLGGLGLLGLLGNVGLSDQQPSLKPSLKAPR